MKTDVAFAMYIAQIKISVSKLKKQQLVSACMYSQ